MHAGVSVCVCVCVCARACVCVLACFVILTVLAVFSFATRDHVVSFCGFFFLISPGLELSDGMPDSLVIDMSRVRFRAGAAREYYSPELNISSGSTSLLLQKYVNRERERERERERRTHTHTHTHTHTQRHTRTHTHTHRCTHRKHSIKFHAVCVYDCRLFTM